MLDVASPHAFDEAVQLEALASGRFRGRITPAYDNMVGPFGGTIAAVMLNAVLSHPQRQGDPVALTVNFAAPIKNAAFEVTACVARTNRSNQHWTIQLEQEGAVAITATVLLATRRASWSATEAQPPQAPPADRLQAFSAQGMPEWVSSYDLRFVQGDLTLDGVERADSVSTLWVRDASPRLLDFLSLTAISDVFFPRVMTRRQVWVPAGTVTMSLYFHADAAALAQQGSAHLLATARASRYHDMYFDQTAQLWGADKSLLAVMHQMVYYRP